MATMPAPKNRRFGTPFSIRAAESFVFRPLGKTPDEMESRFAERYQGADLG